MSETKLVEGNPVTPQQPIVPPPYPNRVKEYRARAGLKACELAKVVGMNPSGICRLEAGRSKPLPRTADRIAARFGVSTRTLFPSGVYVPLFEMERRASFKPMYRPTLAVPLVNYEEREGWLPCAKCSKMVPVVVAVVPVVPGGDGAASEDDDSAVSCPCCGNRLKVTPRTPAIVRGPWHCEGREKRA